MEKVEIKGFVVYLSKKLIPEKVFFEYTKNSITSYEALKNADLPGEIVEIFNKYQLE